MPAPPDPIGPPPSFTLRRASPADAPAYRVLRLEALRDHPTAFSADYTTNLAKTDAAWAKQLQPNDETGVLYLAWHDDSLVGMTGLYRDPSPKTRHSGTIWGVYVQSAYRGRGLSTRLIAACLDWGRAHGITIAHIGVTTTNAPAIAAYLRSGFQVYGVQPRAIHYQNTYYDELLMYRLLS